MLYFGLFVALASIAATAFKLWSMREAQRRAARWARMKEPILPEAGPRRPAVRSRPPEARG